MNGVLIIGYPNHLGSRSVKFISYYPILNSISIQWRKQFNIMEYVNRVSVITKNDYLED